MGKDDLRPVEQSEHGGTGDWAMVSISWFRVEAAVDLLARRAVQIPHFDAKSRRLDKGFSKGSNADIVSLALRGLDVVSTVSPNVTVVYEMDKIVCVRLHPGAG